MRNQSTAKIQTTAENSVEQRVQIKRGRKLVMDRIVCLDREELDAFLTGCRLIEEILEKSKGGEGRDNKC